MPHAFTTYSGLGHFHATAIANDPLVLDALVLAAGTFIILRRAKNTLAEKTVFFWLQRTIVDRLGLLDLAPLPFANGLWGRDADRNRIKSIHIVVHTFSFSLASSCLSSADFSLVSLTGNFPPAERSGSISSPSA